MIWGSLLVLLMSSCVNVGPDFVSPETDAPPGWSEELAAGLIAEPPKLGNWWLMFNDPVLNGLVALSHRNNNTLEIAGVRILEARAQLGIATGLQYPQSQIAAGDATYISPAENTGPDIRLLAVRPRRHRRLGRSISGAVFAVASSLPMPPTWPPSLPTMKAW